MQQEDTTTTGSDSQNSDSNNSFAVLLGDNPLAKKLSDKTPTALDLEIIPQLMNDKNVIANTRQAFQELSCILIPLAALSSKTEKAVVIVPSLSEADRAYSFLQELGVDSYLESGDEAANAKPQDAAIIIGTPEGLNLLIQEKKLKVARVAIIGFESSLPVIPSEELLSIMEELSKNELKSTSWMSKSVPLVLTGFVKTFVKQDSESCVEVNLDTQEEFQVDHIYYELPRDLLAKPNALCDLLESFNRPKTLIYCNAPSDADLADALLNRKGIPSKKLIGHIPDRAVHAAFDQIQNGELVTLVVTDISARSLPVEQFEMIFHYSTPDDPEVYIHRFGHPTEETKLRKVVSLVGSTDLGDFHYLKKIVEFEFKKEELPSGAELSQLQIKRLLSDAQNFTGKSEEIDLATIAKQLSELKSDEQETVITYLLHNTLTALPAALSSSRQSKRPERERRDNRDSREDTRRGRGSSRDRDNTRDDNRRNDRGRDRDRGRNSDDDHQERAPREREQYAPPKRDVRLYIGRGKEQGLTEEKIGEILTEAGLDAQHKPQRIILRSCYAFVDFPEEGEKEILNTLEDKDFADGEKMVVIKAAKITQPREALPKDESESQDNQESDEQVEQASA